MGKEMSSTLEYKDKNKEWQLTHTHTNGNITLATTEGYKNRIDMRTSMINACIEILEHYKEEMSINQINKITNIFK